MGILDKLFGKQQNSADMIRMYDSAGNQISMLKSEYRKNVLPGAFKKAHGHPDELYGAIVLALQDGFPEECLPPARQLYQIDANKERCATILGIVLMKNKLLDEAQEVLDSYLKQYGDSGVVLTNLAKVYADKGQQSKAMEILWKALTVDPNQDNALDWWGAIHHEKEGNDGLRTAVEKVAQIPGSWRPQLWIARTLLEQRKINDAITLYKHVLSSAPDAGDALMMISGDLGNNGYVAEILDLALPNYEPRKHGPMAGLNLIRACIHLGKKETGLELCAAIEKLQRYDLKQHIEQLKAQLKKM